MATDRTVLTPSPPRDPQWGGHLLDLDAYLRRVGHPATPTTPESLHRAHRAAIAFENVDVALERGISLELPDVQRKLVTEGRGGYCFEHNLLFAAVLEATGVPVTRLLARVRQGKNLIRYRAHTTLLVDIDGETHLADVGFGAEGLLTPLPFTDGATHAEGGFAWRLVREGDEDWVLQSLHADGWFDLYAFRLEHHHAVDFDVSNHYTATHPRSTFTGKLVAMRGDAHSRQTLMNSRLTTRYADGRTEERELTGAEVIRALRETFAIRLTDLDARLLTQRLSTTFTSSPQEG
ncbi:arylamine N-acetyltransferase family protein [Streptomyces acidiscabies]|uniref:Arylamine N-acetyltransferase n=1 Tax=Streptomyces acidiscabies TaxID=42234 RepID=A0AAP6BFF3_9ACTN|nr:arylamine N-acetyltransferase [Streptomyces acidiscabies]MBP5941122.1 arylamine N-acetyltransferase [Streptomyces sp. LBUM 1476]MBZ3912443.1 arylamine N-acetyltransferase [Streptomyces acidiscabies]MDX2963764.1 arylamine N-acetyltransferase [Streptomyces acidiscabies]MDX3021595.1 arylamine N-acetyltransferase [Streptomyces acidiscabies]MDX3793862.1 arylamine N-acetyltransferase [Streptomyces acidiscabies]